jgi:hypothetical protein
LSTLVNVRMIADRRCNKPAVEFSAIKRAYHRLIMHVRVALSATYRLLLYVKEINEFNPHTLRLVSMLMLCSLEATARVGTGIAIVLDSVWGTVQ